MADRQMTEKLIKEIKKHGESALEAIDQAMEMGPEKGGIGLYDFDLRVALEHDLGVGYRDRVGDMSEPAIEAIITSGMFHKMVQRQIRFGLMENPREQYKLLSMIAAEDKDECGESYRDWGVFADMDVHELTELQKAPLYSLATDYLDHPVGKMYGNAMAWTREAMCKDPNGFVRSKMMALVDAHQNKIEDRLLDALVGYNYTYDRSGTEYAVYYGDGTIFTDGANGPWVNSLPLAIDCPDSFEELKQLWRDMTDLVHGRPIMWNESAMSVITSLEQASALRKILNSTQVEEDVTCAGKTFKYIMTPQVASDISFVPMGYRRFAEKVEARYGVTTAEAREWMFFGQLNEFMGLIYQIRPRSMRVPLAGEEFRRRIVAMYTTESKFYPWIKDPQKGVMVTYADSAS